MPHPFLKAPPGEEIKEEEWEDVDVEDAQESEEESEEQPQSKGTGGESSSFQLVGGSGAASEEVKSESTSSFALVDKESKESGSSQRESTGKQRADMVLAKIKPAQVLDNGELKLGNGKV